MTDFEKRHIGIQQNDELEMLNLLKVNTLDDLIKECIPASIRLKKELNLPDAISEKDWLSEINQLADENLLFKNFIGQGYYGTHTPSVILRNIFENPGWYTAYTPYQAEISQGRMEALLNFQTMVTDLTGMEMANASLLDEATATAEAMIMLWGSRKRAQVKKGQNVFLVDEQVFKQNKLVIQTRAQYLGIELKVVDLLNYTIDDKVFGALVQYPNAKGAVVDYGDLGAELQKNGAHLVVAADLLSLTLLKEPAQFNASVVVGSSQRFGVPLGFGGPHAAYFATLEQFKRNIPGRIIGVSKDAKGRMAYRMALQTREQHIKREKATSNICTAQALLAIMASMYAVYHGPKGLKNIASNIHNKANTLKCALEKLGFEIHSEVFFDTLTIINCKADKIQKRALANELNFHYHNSSQVSISIDEMTTDSDLLTILKAFTSDDFQAIDVPATKVDFGNLNRSTSFLKHEVFNTYHTESEMMRYIKRLENKDISLVHGMISLGSCTMKLNAASEMMPLSNPKFNSLHPFVPKNQSKAYQKIFKELRTYLCEITGFHDLSFQPNSGAQGELSGLLCIKKYLESKGETQRNIVIIPASAHGTNPASAVMAGMKVVVTKCDEEGNIDLEDLREKVELHKDNLAALMVTYPSTHGVFEESILEITDLIHRNGGQVYMDGANMNAQVGLTSPMQIGADVCHLNLHKTFAIPHGGGGPGMGPIGVAKHLSPHLPNEDFNAENDDALGVVAGAPNASALILIISLGYIKMLGAKGVCNATKYAILNANYLKAQLQKNYSILYTGKNNRVAHELIIDCRKYKELGVDIMDIAKRLIDYGFHAPTVSFPVPGTMMLEPTESESKKELDVFIAAMEKIAEEIKEIEMGIYPKEDNVLVNAPHPAQDLMDENWNHPYSRKKAAYPLDYLKTNKFWTNVSRIDNAYGDRNLMCTCLPIDAYNEEQKLHLSE